MICVRAHFAINFCFLEAVARICSLKKVYLKCHRNTSVSNFIKNENRHKCFPVNLAKILKPAF